MRRIAKGSVASVVREGDGEVETPGSSNGETVRRVIEVLASVLERCLTSKSFWQWSWGYPPLGERMAGSGGSGGFRMRGCGERCRVHRRSHPVPVNWKIDVRLDRDPELAEGGRGEGNVAISPPSVYGLASVGCKPGPVAAGDR